MITLEFEDIYNSFHNKIDAYDFLELTEDEINEFEISWLKTAGSKPYVRRLFSSYKFDEDEEVIEFEMRYATDDDADLDFVTEILALGMVVAWLMPKVNSMDNIFQVYGSKEEKLRDIVSRFAATGNGVVYSFEYAGTPLETQHQNEKLRRYLSGNGLKSLCIGQSAGKV